MARSTELKAKTNHQPAEPHVPGWQKDSVDRSLRNARAHAVHWGSLGSRGSWEPGGSTEWTGPEGSAQQLKYEFKSNETRPASLPTDSKLFAIENPDQAKLATDVASAFAKLMG